ncbi:MAG: hypothetical protein QXP32_02180 [Nitrososphaeria archaeon]
MGKVSGLKDKDLVILLFSAVTFFILSFWIHFPGLRPNYYSDIIDVLWNRYDVRMGKIPYIEYDLEYPAFSGLVLYVATLTGNVYGYYLVFALVSFVCMLGSLYIVYRIGVERSVDVYKIGLYTVFTPTFIFYSVYSFDWFGVFFLLLSLLFLLKEHVRYSGIFLGLSAAARLIPILVFPYMLQHLKGKKDKIVFTFCTFLGWLTPNIYFMIVNFYGFLYPYFYQAGWVVEDSWLAIFQQYNKGVSAGLMFILAYLIFYLEKVDVMDKCWLVLTAFVISSFKFPPQYMIMLMPFFALSCKDYVPYIFSHIFNVMILFWWFTPMFSFGNPWSIESPVQWSAIIRQALIAYIFVKSIRLYLRKGSLP